MIYKMTKAGIGSSHSVPPKEPTKAELEANRHPLAGRIVYLAGPMTGYPEYNYPLFQRVAAELRELGAVVMSPAEHSLPMETPRHVFMQHGFTKLLQCTDICLLPFWSLSEGASIECQVALSCGMKAWMYLIDPVPTDSPTPRPGIIKQALLDSEF